MPQRELIVTFISANPTRMSTGCSKVQESEVNLHVFSVGCAEVARTVAFRDWLRTNQADRDLYARTKKKLAQQTWTYTQNYADAKTPVIEEIMSRISGEGTILAG